MVADVFFLRLLNYLINCVKLFNNLYLINYVKYEK